MQEDQQTEPDGQDEDSVIALRKVRESLYPGQPAVIVRTTRLPGPEPNGKAPVQQRSGSAPPLPMLRV
jgi:hypothetical protein